ncbi:MAG: hypothetical protein K8S55_08275 [Phycisphaerae bacterium]|nr:hypothetical protein [Phycisphaerae bacterium]
MKRAAWGICGLLLAIFLVPAGCEQAPQHGVTPSTSSDNTLKFVYVSHWTLGRIMLLVSGEEAGLDVRCILPKGKLSSPTRHEIGHGEGFAEVRLYRGNDIASYLAPSGSPRVPRPNEKAVGGTLVCKPLDGKKAIILLEGLQFESGTIPKVGPFEVVLDYPPPP